MPGIDGISLTKQALAAAPSLRVILMSGYTEQLERARGFASGQVRTLSKPFTLDKARAEVKAALA
jgi:CheY-like chemotaxis protein